MTLSDSGVILTAPGVFLGVAASAANGIYGVAEQTPGDVFVRTNNNPTPTALAPSFIDLDARFGHLAALGSQPTGSVGLSIWNDGVWRTTGSVTGAPLSCALYQEPGLLQNLAIYEAVTTTVVAHGFAVNMNAFTQPNGTVTLRADGGQLPQSVTSFKVRPDRGGEVGLVVWGTTMVRVPSGSGSTYAVGAPLQGANVCQLASSESQQALVGCVMPRSAPPRTDAVFWQPDGSVADPTSTTFVLSSTSGVADIAALATTGTRHAAVIPASATDSNWDLGGVGLQVPANQWNVVLFGGTRTRVVNLGPSAGAPVFIAFGVRPAGTPGLFITFNCLAAGGPCVQPGGHLAFLADP